MHTRRWTTWLLYMIFTTTFARADLLSMSTEIVPAKTTCMMKINEQITDITIDPLNLLHKLRQELITVTNIKTSIKKDTSNNRKWPIQIGNIKVQNITTENMITESLNMMPGQLKNMIIDQHKIINLLSQSVYTTSTEYKNINVDADIQLLDQIPKITKTFLTHTDFDEHFIASQQLNLDHTIQKATNRLSKTITDRIISENKEMISTQFETLFNKEWPQQTKIGFSQTTSPKDFTTYFGKIIQPKDMEKLLAIIQFTKQNIAFKCQQQISSTATRSTKWIESLNYKPTKEQIKDYEEKANQSMDIDNIHKRAIKATVFLANTGRKALKILTKQAKKHGTNLIRKAINHKLNAEEKRLKLDKKTTQNTANLNRMISQNKKQPALGNTLILRDGLKTIFRHKRTIAEMSQTQQKQTEYTRTIFKNELPLQLLDTMPHQKCRISVSLQNTQFRIRYEYFQDMEKMPTFEIQTIPFLINNIPFKLNLPSQIAILPNGHHTIIEPTTLCKPRCECTDNTIQIELPECIKAILQSKYVSNRRTPVNSCIKAIKPTEPKETKIIQSDSETYSIFTPNQTNAETTCGRNKQTQQLDRGINNIKIPYGCTIRTQNITMTNYRTKTNENTHSSNQYNIQKERDQIKTMKKQIIKAITELQKDGNESIQARLIKKQANITSKIENIKRNSTISIITTAALAIIGTLLIIISATIAITKKCTKKDKNTEEELQSIFTNGEEQEEQEK